MFCNLQEQGFQAALLSGIGLDKNTIIDERFQQSCFLLPFPEKEAKILLPWMVRLSIFSSFFNSSTAVSTWSYTRMISGLDRIHCLQNVFDTSLEDHLTPLDDTNACTHLCQLHKNVGTDDDRLAVIPEFFQDLLKFKPASGIQT